jgi:hypothetical protein
MHSCEYHNSTFTDDKQHGDGFEVASAGWLCKHGCHHHNAPEKTSMAYFVAVETGG